MVVPTYLFLFPVFIVLGIATVVVASFIEEIKSTCYKKEIDIEKQRRTRFICPTCKSGHLILREDPSTGVKFYGCSNFPYCKYTNNDLESVEKNIRCPKCGDYLTIRKGRYGKFYGCHSYPVCNYKYNIESNFED